ncbi:MAG: RdgB/HAM1 family non-canonical purine NTP pyrophosphatase [Gemmatimonadetes bacterium]|nr:RdgB/HAM1 family non-canonical purine NTP pyrophosphatase [Gemmatimonadota bacterium]
MDAEPRLLIATRSSRKVREIADVLSLRSARIATLDDIGIPVTAAEGDIETFDTFVENALAKAAHFHRASGLPALADDSGLAVHALNGQPGVRSRRYSRRSDLTGDALDDANNQTLLDALASLSPAQRTAHYVCAVALCTDRAPVVAVGTVRGLILESPRGTGGFGYDPLFLLPDLNRTFAECDRKTKHAWSHRGRAFRALAQVLRDSII